MTANPAIDRAITVDRLAFEDRSYILSTQDSPGGRGINASSVIHSFGDTTLAILPAGGVSGGRFQEFLMNRGIPAVIVPIRNKVRTNLTIMDRRGLTIKLNELGPRLSKGEVTRLEHAVREHMMGVAWLMLCGSLPPGVPSDFYARLIETARQQGVKTMLDTDGSALQAGLEAKPTVVKPNQEEAERLLSTALITRTNSLHAAERILKMGAESVVLTLGSRGAIGARGSGLLEGIAPPVTTISPIGSGDAMAAAFVSAMHKKDDFADALRWGVAAGTASAQLPGMSFATFEQTQEIYSNVEVHRVD